MGTSDQSVLRARQKTREQATEIRAFDKERVTLQTSLRDTQALVRDLLRGYEAPQ